MTTSPSSAALAPPAAAADQALEWRSGPLWWVRGYALMVWWYLATLKTMLPIIMVIQVMFGGGMVIGLGLLLPEVPTEFALYLATGSTVVVMMTIGLVMVPAVVSESKAFGYYDFLWSLPVPRMANMLAAMTVYVVVAIPGIGVALGVAVLRYDIPLAISPQVIPVALLVLLSATSIGFLIGHLSPGPMITNLITNVLIFVLFLFSPVNYPAERLPGWAQSIHDWLPFEHAANAMRASLTDTLGEDVGRSIIILSIWAVASWVGTYWVLEKKR